MTGNLEIFWNTLLLAICYVYIVAMIFLSVQLRNKLPINVRRKFLHIMIGIFVFVIPFFTLTSFPLIFPFFVAFPFILLTFFASPVSPIRINQKIPGLADLTTSGHEFGLLFYSISYTALAFFFSDKPYIIIVGILPMAFGDAAASLVGLKLGRHKIGGISNKSFEGSAAMFLITLVSVTLTLFVFSYLCPFSLATLVLASLAVALVATLLEAVTPKGLDNLSVPLISAFIFLLLVGGL